MILVVPSTLSPENARNDPVFHFKPVKEPCSRRRLEHPHHGGYNPALLNEIDLPLENGHGVSLSNPTIKPPITCNPGGGSF
jgi:hypothetical protein